MAQLQKKFLANNAVDGSKIKLNNNENLKARNAANSGDVNIVKVNASDRIEFASVPQSPSDASTGNDLVRYSQFAAALDGLKPKAAVVVASTGNIDLSVAADPSPIDGHTIADGDRVLLWQQTSSAENGIYVAVTAIDPTTWTRSVDFDAPSEIPGAYTVAEFGTLYQGVLFVSTSSPGTIGTDPINFAMRTITVNTYTGGDMIALSGNAFSVDLASTSGLESTNPGNAAGQLRIKSDVTTANTLGVTITTDGAGVKYDSASFTETSETLKLASGVAGNGLTLTAGVLDVVSGNTAITANANDISLTLATNSGLEISSGLKIKPDVTTANTLAVTLTANGAGTKYDANSFTESAEALALASGVAGAGLALTTGVLSVNVDNSTLEIPVDTLQVKDAGITLAKLASNSVDENKIVSTTISTTGALNGGSGTKISTRVDAVTVKINGSNNLESLKETQESITLSGTDITNQYVDLAHAIYGTSASVNSASLTVVGGTQQQKTVDYTVSLTGGSGGVTRITFAGDLATGGAAALIATDILMIDYSYLT